MGNFDFVPRVNTSSVFDYLDSSCYDNEKKVYGKQINEVINQYGNRCFYYIVDYNTDRDPIFGEDTDRYITRKFPVQATFDLPEHEDMVSLYGIEEMDNFDMFISTLQFAAASTLEYNDSLGETSGTFPSHIPIDGDLIRLSYSSQIYEVLHVKDTDDQFLQSQHVWKFTVRKYRDLHFSSTSAYTSAISEVTPFMDQQDMFDIADVIDTIKTDIVTSGDKAPSVNNPDDPFSGW